MTQKEIFQTARNVLVGNCPEGQPRKASSRVLQTAARKQAEMPSKYIRHLQCDLHYGQLKGTSAI